MTGTTSPVLESSPLPPFDDSDSPLSSPTRLDFDEFSPEPFQDVATKDEDAEEPVTNGQNGHAEDDAPVKDEPDAQAGDALDDRPSKRRRLRGTTPTSSPIRKKPESPPWKKVEAAGPSSFVENGRRKSGRINAVPLEMQQGDKRITRGALHGLQSSLPSKTRSAPTTQPAPSHSAHQHAPSKTATSSKTPPAKPQPKHDTRRQSVGQESKASSQPKHDTRRQSIGQESKASSQTRPAPPAPVFPGLASRVAGTRRSSRHHGADEESVSTPAKDGKPQAQETPPSRTRIRLRLYPALTAVPVVHPDEVRRRPKIASSLEEFMERAPLIPVEQGGLLTPDDPPQYTDQMALKDAKTIERIEAELQPGGILTPERCSAFAPEPAEEPPRQWAHNDHLLKQLANFRRLMQQEQQRHRALAKKLAEACRDEWIRRQPKTEEQIEAEMRELWRARYKVLLKVLSGTWDNVRAEINRRRLEQWEAEEAKRMKAALNEAVNMSELKLQARRAHFDSDMPTEEGEEEEEAEDDEEDEDEEEEGEEASESPEQASGSVEDTEADNPSSSSGSASTSDEDDNMSSSDDEEDDRVDDDAELTQEQLRLKYAGIPDLEKPSPAADDGDDDVTEAEEAAQGGATTDHDADDDTSDESIDMDDDLGSSEEEMDSDASEGDDEDSDEEPTGLLSLFFGKSELKKMKEEAKAKAEAEADAEAETEAEAGAETEAEAEAEKKAEADAEAKEEAETDAEANAEAVASAEGEKADTEMADADQAQEAGPTELVADGEFADTCGPAKTAINATDGDAMEVDDDTFVSQRGTGSPSVQAPAASVADAPIAQVNGIKGSEQPDSAMTGVPLTDASVHVDAEPRTLPDKASPSAAQSPQKAVVFDSAATVFHPVTHEPARVETAEILPDENSPRERQPSPDTEAITSPPTPGQSQSLQSAETKATELDSVSPRDESATKDVTSRQTTPPVSAPRTEIPFLLRGTLREYQHYGLDWLAGLYANNTNGILADEMGLGKTIQTIALLAHLACHHEVWGPHLVIVPTSVMLNWEMEFKKWCPGFKILAYYGTQDERKRKRQGWNNDDVWNVCITSYQLVLQDQQVFKRRRWHYMILDEAHNIKNFKSQRWQTLLGFNTQARLLLTGTPLQNNLTELWSLLFFLMPSETSDGGAAFADLQEFHDWFRKPESQILESGREEMDDEARAIIAKLHKMLRPYLLRRLKADVEKQMPAKYEHVEFCRLSKRQRELYDGFLARTDTREALASGNYLSIINCLMQLRKVCNHPDLFMDRPIVTSFRMEKSVPASYEEESFVRRRMFPDDPMANVRLEFLNLVPTRYEWMSTFFADSIFNLSNNRRLNDLKDAQRVRAKSAYTDLDPTTVKSNLVYLESAARWRRFEELQHCVYLNALRRQQRPIYGKNLIDLLTIGVDARPQKPKPKIPQKILSWFEEDSTFLKSMVPTLAQRSASLEMTITKFSCVTPAVVARDMTTILLGDRAAAAFTEMDLKLSAPVKYLPFMPRQPPVDPWHEARMRLSIQFPDKRLLQYDCGKLQALDRLLRKLQAGGHRALIFTQMTKVLDILERFLNIHGHKYLRLDGATKVEQRQILTERFNHDTRILCFILSTRSGGLGINLTGADTVIFYDQDWNPAMDKQCQDRCHRIGQTRDVHIYRLVSEHTIEVNILRKARQKEMLDDVVIQEGEFTTDYFNRVTARDTTGGVPAEEEANSGDAAAANAAMDRVLGVGDESSTGGRSRGVGTRVLEQAEDREDVAAAHVAEREIQTDDADFLEKGPGAGASSSGASTARQGTPLTPGISGKPPGRSGLGLYGDGVDGGTAMDIDLPGAEEEEPELNAWGEPVRTIDDYMLRVAAVQLEGTPLEIPKDKKKGPNVTKAKKKGYRIEGRRKKVR